MISDNIYINNFLIQIIRLFHIIIILFVILTPFITKNILILILYITFSICLIFHWYNNNDACCLTLLEQKLRNISNSELENRSFMYNLISPVYHFSDTEKTEDMLSKINYIWITLCSIICVYSIYKQLKNHKTINDKLKYIAYQPFLC